jgi:hypothetical protein
MTRRGILMLLVILGCNKPAQSAELTIHSLLADPQPYHMKIVTLTGTSHQVQALRDAPNALSHLDFQCYLVHPPYTFVLADDTGFLQISVRGRPPCVSQHSPAEPPEVAEGSVVQVDLQIRVTPVSQDGMPTQAVEAQAVGIRRLYE